MHRLTSPLAVLIIFVLVASCTGSAQAAPPAKARWTVMVYISGDNDLESYVVPDIETELAPTGSSANVQVVALADRIPGYDTSAGDWTETLLFHVADVNGQDMKATRANAVENWGEKNMGDAQTLIDFVTWTRAHYPADHYALYFWGHGWNWHPGYVMRDDTNNGTIDYQEMKAALPSIGFIDVVGYDGCNMSSIEVFDLWHGYATAVTSSQEYVTSEGLQYDLILAGLAENPAMSADQLAIISSQSASVDKTWSAVAVDSRYDELFAAVSAWADALKIGLPTYRSKYDRAFGATRSFWQATMDKDLYDMAYEVNRLVADGNIRTKSQAVMAAIDAVILHERHVNAYADVHGITIYHISKAIQKDLDYAYYRSTVDFALDTGWDEFLDLYAK